MPVDSNEILILNSILKEYKKQKDENLSSSEIFELFSNEQILKDFDLNDDELMEGVIDGGDDGGIDSIYIFINGQLCDDGILEEETISNFKTNNTTLTLYLIQSKESETFKETVTKFILSTAKDFFELGTDLDKTVYNPLLIDKRNLFKNIFLTLAPYHPIVNIKYVYATKGKSQDINPKIHHTIQQIIENTKNMGLAEDVSFKIYGADELINLYRVLPQYRLPLKFKQIMNLKDSYISLVSINDYYEFITENGQIREYLFEANIRDHQGNVVVNKEIKNTLEKTEELDVNFWWLNNGITIIATDATIAAETINLDKIQIVNGLQTSYSIYQSYSAMIEQNKEKVLLVRIILIPEDDNRTDDIIKATNSQTPLSAAALRATDIIQRNIEDYLKSKNLFYDRRKNFYKNKGKNAEQIVSIPYMAQVINALLLKAPHVSRSAPGSLVKNDNNYNKIFKYNNIEVYFKSIIYMKKVLNIIKNYNIEDYTRHEKLDFQYHIGLKILQKLFGNNFNESHILSLDLTDIQENVVIEVLKFIIDNARKQATNTNSTILAIAKSKDFTDFIMQA